MCATHNEKLSRSVCVKKVCERKDDCGEISWVNREVTVMICPAAKRVSLKSQTQPELVSPNQRGPITKRVKYSELSESEQRISTSDGSSNRITRIGEDETISS